MSETPLTTRLVVEGKELLETQGLVVSRWLELLHRAPTQVPATNKGQHGEKMCFSVVGCLLLVLAGRGPSCSGSLVRFPGPVVLPGSFLFGRRPKYRSFLSILWPRASCSSSRREGRRARRKGTDPSTGPFRYPSTNVEYVFNLKFAYMLTLGWWFSSRSSPSFSSSLCWLSIFPE